MYGKISAFFAIGFVVSLIGLWWFVKMATPDPNDAKSQETINKWTTIFACTSVISFLGLLFAIPIWRKTRKQLNAAEQIVELWKTSPTSNTLTEQCDTMYANDYDDKIAEQYLSLKTSKPMSDVMGMCNHRAQTLLKDAF